MHSYTIDGAAAWPDREPGPGEEELLHTASEAGKGSLAKADVVLVYTVPNDWSSLSNAESPKVLIGGSSITQ